MNSLERELIISKPQILQSEDLRYPCLQLKGEITNFLKKHPIFRRRFDAVFEDEGNFLIDSLEFPNQPETNTYVLGCITSGEVYDLVCNCTGLIMTEGIEKTAADLFNINAYQKIVDSFETNKEFRDNLLVLRTFKMEEDQAPERVDACIDLKLSGMIYDESAPWARLIKYSEIIDGVKEKRVQLKHIYDVSDCANFDKFVREYSDNLDELTGRDVVYATMFADIAQKRARNRSRNKSTF